ncbi:MAG: hypothetical protein Q8O32_01435 [bacterium]|nr:hypothetical protein [bacterium]
MKIDKLIENSDIGEKTEKILVRVLSKFSPDLQDFVINNISFIEAKVENKWNSKNNHIGFCMDVTKYSLSYLIVLDSKYYKLKEEHKTHIIAHEIGHAFLGHSGSNVKEELCEKEADDFVKKYGFFSSDIGLGYTLKFLISAAIMIAIVMPVILIFLMLVYVDKIEYLLQWMVFI